VNALTLNMERLHPADIFEGKDRGPLEPYRLPHDFLAMVALNQTA
jgi:hypothetical protein